MKNYLRILLAFIIICFCTSSRAIALDSQEPGMAVDFTLKDLKENMITLSSYIDKQPVILFFWTTWCTFCRRELKILNRMHPQLIKEGWEILAINIGEPDYKVETFTRNYDLVFKVLLDTDSVVADSYNLLGVPTYIIVDKKGNVVFKDNYFPQQYKELVSGPLVE